MRPEYQKDRKTSTERGFADYLSWFEKSWCGTFNATNHGIGVEMCSKNSSQILLDPGLIGDRQRTIQATWSVCSTWPLAGRDVRDCKQKGGGQQDVHRLQQGSTCWMTYSRDFGRDLIFLQLQEINVLVGRGVYISRFCGYDRWKQSFIWVSIHLFWQYDALSPLELIDFLVVKICQCSDTGMNVDAVIFRRSLWETKLSWGKTSSMGTSPAS